MGAVELCVIKLRPVPLVGNDLACTRDNVMIERLSHGGKLRTACGPL